MTALLAIICFQLPLVVGPDLGAHCWGCPSSPLPQHTLWRQLYLQANKKHSGNHMFYYAMETRSRCRHESTDSRGTICLGLPVLVAAQVSIHHTGVEIATSLVFTRSIISS